MLLSLQVLSGKHYPLSTLILMRTSRSCQKYRYSGLVHTKIAFALAFVRGVQAFAVVRAADPLVSRFGGPDLGKVDAVRKG